MKTLDKFIEESQQFKDMDVNRLEAFCTLCCQYFEKFGTKDDFIDFEKFEKYDTHWFFTGYGYKLQSSFLEKTGDKYEKAAKQLYSAMKEYYKIIK